MNPLLAAIAISVLVPTLIGDQDRFLPPPVRNQDPIRTRDKGKVLDRLAASNAKYQFSDVEQRMKNSRQEIAACLWKDSHILKGRYHLKMFFSPSATLKNLEVSPPVPEVIVDCFRDLVSGWLLNPSPTATPFVFEANLAI